MQQAMTDKIRQKPRWTKQDSSKTFFERRDCISFGVLYPTHE